MDVLLSIRICVYVSIKLPKLGIKFSILSGMFLVGGAFVLLG